MRTFIIIAATILLLIAKGGLCSSEAHAYIKYKTYTVFDMIFWANRNDSDILYITAQMRGIKQSINTSACNNSYDRFGWIECNYSRSGFLEFTFTNLIKVQPEFDKTKPIDREIWICSYAFRNTAQTNKTTNITTTVQKITRVYTDYFNFDSIYAMKTVASNTSILVNFKVKPNTTGVKMEINPCFILEAANGKCGPYVYNVSGITINTCEIVTEAGLKYIEVNYGSTTSQAASFALKIGGMLCENSKVKDILLNVYDEAKNIVEKVAIPIIYEVIETVTNILSDDKKDDKPCMDWNEQATILRNEKQLNLAIKEVQVGDQIMTIEDNQVKFVPIIVVALHKVNSNKKNAIRITAVLKNGTTVFHNIVPEHFLHFLRDNEWLHLPCHELVIGDSLYYISTPDSRPELAKIISIEEINVEGFAHIWTTSMSHCANGLLTSAMVEGDYGLIAHMGAAKAYDIHPLLPTFIYSFVKQAIN